MSGPYRKVFTEGLDHVTQVADPFHVIKLANSRLDECRRRVQNETLGHRGHKGDPLYRVRRLLTKAHERLDQITAWHQAHVSNGPTEAINNLIKRIKRIGCERSLKVAICDQ